MTNVKIKGYFNTKNGIFLGPVTALNEDSGEAITPRYIEGICFGEYDMTTHAFVPLTNPMHIPKGMVYTQDEQIRPDGRLENIRTGMIEDIGADIVSKSYKPIVLKRQLKNTKPDATLKAKSGSFKQKPKATKVEEVATEGITEAVKPKFLLSSDLANLDFSNLF